MYKYSGGTMAEICRSIAKNYFFFKVDSPAVWSNFLVQIYVNIQDLGLFGGSDPGTELDHLKEVKKHFKEWNSISASENARDMVLLAKPMFWGMGNHLGLFSEASDRPEGQELGWWGCRRSRTGNEDHTNDRIDPILDHFLQGITISISIRSAI